MTRLILSVLAGLITTAVLSTATDHIFHTTGVYPDYGQPFFETHLVVLASAYRVVFQMLGGYVTAAIAREYAPKAAWTLGIIGALMWIAGSIAMSGYGPVWYSVVGALLAIPTVMIGSKFYERRTKQANR